MGRPQARSGHHECASWGGMDPLLREAISSGCDGLRDETGELSRENEQLKPAMESRPIIDTARGVLTAGFCCESRRRHGGSW
jgi:hypothetical protein